MRCDIKVSICCITYNHASYIKECIEGFLMQKTDFTFEILIHDDASTDGTEQIIREYEAKYPTLIKPLYESENQWNIGRRGNKVFNYPRAKGKYIALCEGDDYWTDPYKLQKQVDILESDEEIGLVYTDCYKLINKTGNLQKCISKKIHSFESLLLYNNISTLTVCFRRLFLQDYFLNISAKLPKLSLGDYQLWLYLYTKADFYYLPEFTSVYRVLEESASHSKNIQKQLDFVEDIYTVRLFFIEKYIQDLKVKKELCFLIEEMKVSSSLYFALYLDSYCVFKTFKGKLALLKRNKKRLYFLYLIGMYPVGWYILRGAFKMKKAISRLL